MVNYKKYAEELIGNWETGQYEPQRETVQNVYQTNWNKLANDYNTLKDKLARNFSNAQTAYANTLGNIQGEGFNRMRNANIDLANRGLSNSGMVNLVTQADTQRKGEDVDKALASLLATNNASIEGLTKGVGALGQQQSKLASDLAGDLGGITKAEAASGQQYANLLASIGQGKAGRAASRAGSGKSKEDKNLEEMYRALGIVQTLNNDELSDEDKRFILTSQYDVDTEKSKNVVDVYNTNKQYNQTSDKIQNLQNRLDANLEWGNELADRGLNNDFEWLMTRFPTTLNQISRNSLNRRLTNEQNKLNNLTYQDLNELLYGRK